jgi:adenylate cyclase
VSLSLDAIRPCLEGVAYLSQVEYVDAAHLALSFQFFNKTRRNVLENPGVELLVIHPRSGAMYRIRARYERTETEGPLFERMKAKLAGLSKP